MAKWKDQKDFKFKQRLQTFIVKQLKAQSFILFNIAGSVVSVKYKF